MTAFHIYLSTPKVKKVLNTRPGEEGFSLIELVVVVAVLAILAAIAIPSFTAIQSNAAQAAAKNTIATIVKECAVKVAAMEANPTFVVPNISNYAITPNSGTCAGDVQQRIMATSDLTDTSIPREIWYFIQGPNRGQKGCLSGTTAANPDQFCTGANW